MCLPVIHLHAGLLSVNQPVSSNQLTVKGNFEQEFLETRNCKNLKMRL